MDVLARIAEKLRGWKTIAVNGVIAVVMIANIVWPEAEVPTGEDLGGVFDSLIGLVDQATASVVLVVNFINMWLRAVTSTPVFKRD